MGVLGGVGDGGGVGTGVVVGVAPKLGGKFRKDGSGVINLKGFWGDITTKEFEEPDEAPESPELLSAKSLTVEEVPVSCVCYIGINPNTSKPKGIAFNA